VIEASDTVLITPPAKPKDRVSTTPHVKPKNELQACPQCGLLIREHNLSRHLQLRCPKRMQQQTLVTCPKCDRLINQANRSFHEVNCPGPQQRDTVDVSPPISAHEETGVFCDDGQVFVVYKGETITVAGNVQHGRELLQAHIRKVEQSAK
jgi:phage FluMu protein Com